MHYSCDSKILRGGKDNYGTMSKKHSYTGIIKKNKIKQKTIKTAWEKLLQSFTADLRVSWNFSSRWNSCFSSFCTYTWFLSHTPLLPEECMKSKPTWCLNTLPPPLNHSCGKVVRFQGPVSSVNARTPGIHRQSLCCITSFCTQIKTDYFLLF